MSHVATVKTEIKDLPTFKKVLQDKKISFTEGKHRVKLYSKTVDADFSFHLEGWQYPVAVNSEGLHYDNYNGQWGNLDDLHSVTRAYGREVALAEAEEAGFYLEEEQVLQDGSIEVFVSN